MDVAKTADVASRPAGAMPCPLAGSIQDRCDRQIGQLPRQVANEIDNISLNCPAGLADLVFLHRHPGVIATLPMNDERQCVVNGIDNDFFDQQPNDLLACLDRRVGTCAMPYYRSLPSIINLVRSSADKAGVLRSVESISNWTSRSRNRISFSFQRRSSSPATNRLPGSTASYWRRALAASYCACLIKFSSCC